MIYRTSVIHLREGKFPVQSVERESKRQVEVHGLIARTRHEWGLLFMAGLVVYGGVMAWASKWFGSVPVSAYFIGISVMVVATAVTASVFRGSLYYNKRYEKIWDRYS